MKVHPESQKLLTVNTHKVLYVYKRFMYGLNGPPAIWQLYIDALNDLFPNVHSRISATDARESNQIFIMLSVEIPLSQVPNEEQNSSSTTAVPSNDVPAQDSLPLDIQPNISSMRTPLVRTSPIQIPRSSRRIRHPPKRLDI
ncbi:hypothetical protein AVEN_268048-1 [Araneus ventricosus]|uniref:Uncharacterized protein n=1 Tax=Araneus ventricosus TaxID=182803 RepID=A0A4Y2SJN6_ARAVE|nr:hypothetical protein AVEN_268048-1 [Araneus ventricosus]